MKVDNDLISRLEDLAKLELSTDEKAGIQKDLNNILVMVDKLNELDLKEVEPLVYMSDISNMEREDEIKNQLTTEAALKNAPNHDGTYFKVPKFVKK